jgi:hypothetical protein
MAPTSPLHITNADADAKKVGEILGEDTLPWRDFLHDGPLRLLANKADFVQESGIDRWIGGVHLTRQNDWRWNRSALQLQRQQS